MSRRGWAVAALAAGWLVAGAPAAGRAQIGPNGAKAYDMARAADDAARAALDEGRETLAQIQELKPGSRDAEALAALRDQAVAAAEALAAYRKQTQASADEAMDALAGLTGGGIDRARREQVEQRALLAGYEAAVMAARARSQAERLRALHADARALLAGAPVGGSRSAAAAPSTPAEPRVAAPGPGEAVVPNLVGARLDDATRDLTAAGLKLGPTAGPRDGFVVKQSPSAGSRVARQSAVGVTLSGTAAGVSAPSRP